MKPMYFFFLCALTAWRMDATPTWSTLNSVVSVDAHTGSAVGQGGTILKSTLGGARWQDQISGTAAYLYDVFFPNATISYQYYHTCRPAFWFKCRAYEADVT